MTCILFSTTESYAQSQDPRKTKALTLWDEALKFYKTKDYQKASQLFHESNRLFQDSKCLFYYANCLNHLGEGNCTDQISSWERYLDSCQIEKTKNLAACDHGWISKAKEKLSLIQNACQNQMTQIIDQKTAPNLNQDQNHSQTLPPLLNPKNPTNSATSTNSNHLKMNASFFCRYKYENHYEEARSCNGETFKEGDQVSFSVTPLQNAYFYMLLFNEAGQVQMLWPEIEDTDNYLKSNQSYQFPSDQDYNGWWEVDHVRNVTEVILLIMSKNKIEHLEKNRGKEMPYDEYLKNFKPNQKVDRKVIQFSQGDIKKQITTGIEESIEGSGELVVTKFSFKHE